jgi:hypothetical protein
LGFKILRIEATDEPRAKETSASDLASLDNPFYRLMIDSEKGAISSLVDKETGRELVDQKAAWGLGQCIYETMPADRNMKPDLFKRATLRNVTVKPGASGPIWQSLELSGQMDGCAPDRGVGVEIRLYNTAKRIELHFTMRKLPIPTPESVYVALPFHAPSSRMLYEGQGGMVTPGDGQLPGSASDWQTLQSFITIRSAEGQIIAGSEQAPLVQLGDFNLGKWQPVTKVDKPHIYSWVMNNYWFTNFRTEQEGEFKWHYYVTSSTNTTHSFATRFGWGSRVPLVTRVLPPVKNPTTRLPRVLSALTLNAPNVLVVEARPLTRGGGVFLHLREEGGKPVTLTAADVVTWSELQSVHEVNVLEQTLREDIDSLTLEPYEVKFVQLTSTPVQGVEPAVP